MLNNSLIELKLGKYGSIYFRIILAYLYIALTYKEW